VVLAAAEQKPEHGILFAVLQKLVPGLAGKCLEIADARGVSRDNADDLAALHVVQGLLGAQDGQRTIEAPRVDFSIVLQHTVYQSEETDGNYSIASERGGRGRKAEGGP